jgi:hypothetical protein
MSVFDSPIVALPRIDVPLKKGNPAGKSEECKML